MLDEVSNHAAMNNLPENHVERIRNDFLARALYLLAFVEPADADPKNEYEIPYEDLEVRHLGELYENILEFNVTLADADRVRRRVKNGIEVLLLSETEVKKGDTITPITLSAGGGASPYSWDIVSGYLPGPVPW